MSYRKPDDEQHRREAEHEAGELADFARELHRRRRRLVGRIAIAVVAVVGAAGIAVLVFVVSLLRAGTPMDGPGCSMIALDPDAAAARGMQCVNGLPVYLAPPHDAAGSIAK